jgi:hypothetical protein
MIKLLHDVAVELCWRQCYQVMQAMVLPSPTGDDAAETTLIMARCRYRIMLAMVLSDRPGRDMM